MRGNRSFGGKLVFQLLRGWPAVVAGDAAAACPPAAAGPQTRQPWGGVQTVVVQDLACPLPPPPAPPPPLLFYSHSLPASTQSVEPPAGQESAGGVSSSLIKSHEREIFSVSREETPAQFGEKLKALPAETRNLRSRKQNLHFWHSVISCWIKTYHDTIFELG